MKLFLYWCIYLSENNNAYLNISRKSKNRFKQSSVLKFELILLFMLLFASSNIVIIFRSLNSTSVEHIFFAFRICIWVHCFNLLISLDFVCILKLWLHFLSQCGKAMHNTVSRLTANIKIHSMEYSNDYQQFSFFYQQSSG